MSESEYALCTVGIRGQVTVTVGTCMAPKTDEQRAEWIENQRRELVRMGAMPIHSHFQGETIFTPEAMDAAEDYRLCVGCSEELEPDAEARAFFGGTVRAYCQRCIAKGGSRKWEGKE